MESTHLALLWLAAGQAQKHVTVNEALRRLDGIVQASVVALAATRPANLAAMPTLDLLVIDEAHHAVADSYRRIVDHARTPIRTAVS